MGDGDVVPGGKVEFDFEGSLQLARMLWSLAGDLTHEDAGRETQFDTAKAKWKGTYGEQFVERRSTERSGRTNVVEGLRDDARAWATAWAHAMDQQNKNNRAAEVERVRDDRNLISKGWDKTFGEDDSDDKVAEVPAVPIPQPPGFAPTATEKKY